MCGTRKSREYHLVATCRVNCSACSLLYTWPLNDIHATCGYRTLITHLSPTLLPGEGRTKRLPPDCNSPVTVGPARLQAPAAWTLSSSVSLVGLYDYNAVLSAYRYSAVSMLSGASVRVVSAVPRRSVIPSGLSSLARPTVDPFFLAGLLQPQQSWQFVAGQSDLSSFGRSSRPSRSS